MIIPRRSCMLLALAVCVILVLILNVSFLYMLVWENFSEKLPKALKKQNKKLNSPTSVDDTRNQSHVLPMKIARKMYQQKKQPQIEMVVRIQERLSQARVTYRNMKRACKQLVQQLLQDQEVKLKLSPHLWTVAAEWVNLRQVYPETDHQLGSILHYMATSPIMHADVGHRGTQLKAWLILEGGQTVVFKPKWYPRSHIINGPVYAGKDRHNAEVAGFHLSRLLNLRRSPLVVGRRINLNQEIRPVATQKLLDTFFQEGNNTCFYGVCYYCKIEDPVCAEKDIMEGVLLLWLPSGFKLKKHRSPWQRTYKENVPARWEVDSRYCDRVRQVELYNPSNSPRLLDLIDASVFDFLMDNGDRHHYEVFQERNNSIILLLDNGKSFGNPSEDHIDILAPLYQCCLIRRSTWERLQLFRNGALSLSLTQLMSYDPISPILTKSHLEALDRRLLAVFIAVRFCTESIGKQQVIVDDNYR